MTLCGTFFLRLTEYQNLSHQQGLLMVERFLTTLDGGTCEDLMEAVETVLSVLTQPLQTLSST